MIPYKELIEQFQTMYQEHWPYVPGGSSKDGVDCSGAFVYAYRVFNEKIAHGSNTIGRMYIIELLPISEARPGMAAFKCREWTESEKSNRWYGTEPGDLHHIGLVDDDPSYVLNAKGQKYGFCRDRLTEKNGWDYVAYLTQVDYGGGEIKMGKVVLPSGASGSTVNMRAKPKIGSQLIMRVPVGSNIAILSDLGEWCQIMYAGKTGYMMSNYIEYEGQDDHDDDPADETITPDELNRINQALTAIETAVDIIGNIVGRG